MRLLAFLRCPLLLAGASPILAALVNITVDDTFGDLNSHAGFLYSPEWIGRNGTTPCVDCTAQFNASNAFMGTWHEVASKLPSDAGSLKSPPSAAVIFTGSAVYVYCILGPTTGADMTFFLDGQQVGSFVREPNAEQEWQFDVPAYANASIPYGIHTIAIQSGDATNASIFLDYIVYSSHEAQKDSDKTAVVAEAVVVSVGVTLVLSAIVYFILTRLKRRRFNYRLDFTEHRPFYKHQRPPPGDPRCFWSRAQPPVIIPPTRSSSTRGLLLYTPPFEPPDTFSAPERHRSIGFEIISRAPSPVAESDEGRCTPSVPPSSNSSSAALEKAQLSRLYYQNPTEANDIDVPPPIYSSRPDYRQGPLYGNDPFARL